jgi:MFS family permease
MEMSETMLKKKRWQSLWGAMAGWTLDAADWMMLALALPLIQKEFGLSLASVGLLATVTLAGAAIGGSLVGVVADYLGRVKVLTYTMVWYAVFTAACGFAQSFEQLLALRFIVGIGLGGEWGVGAALVSEYWPDKYRARATSFVHSGWPIGYGLASLAFMYIVPMSGWRALFWVGIVPAFIAVAVRLSVPEPQEWVEQNRKRQEASEKKTEVVKFPLVTLFSGIYLRRTILGIAFTSATLMAYWGSATWLPSYLYQAKGLDIVKTGTYLIVLNVGAFFGYQFLGWVADMKGRRFSFGLAMAASIVVTVIYMTLDNPQALLMFGPVFGFFTYGYFGIFGAFLSELFPVEARATGTSFVYNIGRGISMLSPYIIGFVAQAYGLAIGLGTTAAFYVIAMIAIFLLPETKRESVQEKAAVAEA